MKKYFEKMWGETTAFLQSPRRGSWVDLLIILGLGGGAYAVMNFAGEWSGPLRPTVEIDLSPSSLIQYTFYSLMRGLIAYTLSLGFSLAYGYWANKDRTAERVLIPLLDILQSIPVLGFMPGLVISLVALFPKSNIGLELAAVLMIFTGQVWNMTFSFYQSLRSVPQDLREVSQVYRFGWWERLKSVELPFATISLVWNSMMSMAGGWFFLMIIESFVLGHRDFRLPGIGSYVSVAIAEGDMKAMAWAIGAMIGMIVTLDQLLWRPVVAWSQKFRIEEGGYSEVTSSWMLDLIRRSRFLPTLKTRLHKLFSPLTNFRPPRSVVSQQESRSWGPVLSKILFGGILILLSTGTLGLFRLLASVNLQEWVQILSAAGWTLGRVLSAIALGTLWTVPAGLAIGLSPRLSQIFQPIVQVAASFPAPMLFPAVIGILKIAGVPLGLGSVVLMVLGTQWYILFNVIAGAMAVPADLREAARSYRLKFGQRFIHLYLPSIFPFLITGWIAAAGGAWNASIVSEYITIKGEVLATLGLGAQISDAASKANFPVLAGSVVVMSTVVVLFNRTVWRSCYRLAERKFSINK